MWVSSNFIFKFTILQRYHDKKLKMVGLDLIQVTCFICWIACVDGQALYEEKCKIKIDQDVQQLYGKFFSTSFFLSDYVYFLHKIQNICIFVQI